MSIPSWLYGLAVFITVEIQYSWFVWVWLHDTELARRSRLIGFQLAVAHWCVCELRPLFLPAAAILLAHDWPLPVDLGTRFYDYMTFINFLFAKDKDDDRWKRRRAKLASKVQQIGSRLVVVPSST